MLKEDDWVNKRTEMSPWRPSRCSRLIGAPDAEMRGKLFKFIAAEEGAGVQVELLPANRGYDLASTSEDINAINPERSRGEGTTRPRWNLLSSLGCRRL